jgi:hypothetical protein
MKILFVENRYRTFFWGIIAKELAKKGHDIFWIVQNHLFLPKNGKCFFIPYHKKKRNKFQSDDFKNLILSDRAINYYGHKDISHYDYYNDQIEEIINNIKPDVAFGESTLFHELLTIEICKKNNILYLHPTTCRYPVGRFSFYKYDTLEPFGGSDEKMDDENVRQVIKNINKHKIIPDYMKKKQITISSKIEKLRELLTLSQSYFSGEHYNTLHPLKKIKIERKRKHLISQWDEIAYNKSFNTKTAFCILYPMQMQPEANLDVWGRKYRNQLETLKSLIEFTNDNIYIIVKPNPKSKYELTDELLEYIQKQPRIIPVVHEKMMKEILPVVDLVVTVTGTIAIECILADKPVITLVQTINNTISNCLFLDNLNDIMKYINIVKKHKFPQSPEKEKIMFMNKICKSSYIGLPYEKVKIQDNINYCMFAFEDVLNKLY